MNPGHITGERNRTLRATWTIEAQTDLQNWIRTPEPNQLARILTRELTREINEEIDREIMQDLRNELNPLPNLIKSWTSFLTASSSD